MPRGSRTYKKKRSRSSRRTYGSRRKMIRRAGRRPSRRLISTKYPWPQVAHATVNYSGHDLVPFTAAKTGGFIEFRMNSLADPRVAVTGDYGPSGVPEWAKLYSRYTVLGAKVTFTAWPQLVNDSSEFEGYYYIKWLGSNETVDPDLTISGASTVKCGADAVLRQGNIRYTRVNGSYYTGKRPFTIQSYRTVSSVEGAPKKKIRDEADYSGALNTNGTGTDPSIVPRFICGYAVMEDPTGSPVPTVKFQYSCKYYVRFWTPRYPTSVVHST